MVIRQDDLIQSVADALQYISYYHPVDYIRNLAAAYEREQSPAARDAIAQILINSRMCAEGHRPICQDTGIVTVFLAIGMDVRWDGATMGVEDMVNEGVRRAYNHPDNKLRASVLLDPAGKRRNTGDNTPAVVNVKMKEAQSLRDAAALAHNQGLKPTATITESLCEHREELTRRTGQRIIIAAERNSCNNSSLCDLPFSFRL